MALSDDTVYLIREHIGNDDDFANEAPHQSPQFNSLEYLWGVFADVERVALYCWRMRLGSHQNRAFDVAQEGNWLARSQKSKFLKTQVARYERRVGGSGAQAVNQEIASGAQDQENLTTSIPGQ
jgi:hypothetical protein